MTIKHCKNAEKTDIKWVTHEFLPFGAFAYEMKLDPLNESQNL